MKSSDASYFWVGDEDANMPNCYGIAMYLGFEGGHGTVSGLANEFETMQNWNEGSSIALAMATTGLVGATLWGVFLINMAHKRGEKDYINSNATEQYYY
jgi:sodium--glutamate symport carrier gltS